MKENRPTTNALNSQLNKRARIATWFKRGLITIVSLVFLSIGIIAGSFYARSPFIRKLVNNYFTPHNIASVIAHRDIFAPYAVSRQFQGQQQHNLIIALLGCDADYYNDKPVPIPGSPGRSDALLIAHVDFDNNTLNIVSIPRDSAVHIPGHRGFDKINAAHEWGRNALTDATLQQDFGINPDYTVALHFESFQKIVDAVGGVDLYVDKDLNYDDNWGHLHVHLKKGYQHLNGYQAMGFVRIRHCDNDLVREQRQHEFLEALRAKVTSPKTFLALPDILNTVADDIETNMSQGQMLALVHWATQLPQQNIHFSILPCVEGRSYVYIKPAEATKMLADMLYNGDTTKVSLNVVPPPNKSLALNPYSRRRSRYRHHTL
ncbi:transcriptional attenuator, LytR family [Chthonomonas calidirosea]|uniref:Transcriptional attenuator, LytR family n=1 Tax=Chthonomonas calidirosea (strain DSM 23976 / ICMP 18418 / T49) TaxID=1303518 RepID=S0ES97_CHTCT|nr:LCP family protein [Chthonomonas calidirosea]CCW34066.1 transcriptional attenuator, LytR family [Chthonomonas calidirosea T49]CEK14718.1 transcriptional attenuator, LytR family [Chthonomonas calidirosea]CEK15851.1 transcriptional attenuator, LytR family [Chthonomonas calidirosea]